MIRVTITLPDSSVQEIVLSDPSSEEEVGLFRDLAYDILALGGGSEEIERMIDEMQVVVMPGEGMRVDVLSEEMEAPHGGNWCGTPSYGKTDEELDRMEFEGALKPAKYSNLREANVVNDEHGIPKYRAYVKCTCGKKIKNHIYRNENFVRCRDCGRTHTVAPFVPDVSQHDEFGSYFMLPIYTRAAREEFKQRRLEELKSPTSRPIFTTSEGPEETLMAMKLREKGILTE